MSHLKPTFKGIRVDHHVLLSEIQLGLAYPFLVEFYIQGMQVVPSAKQINKKK